jgi:glutamate synthase (NADPH/NADH) small chain
VVEELRPALSPDQVLVEADRCLERGGPEAEAPCVEGCPAGVDIPTSVRAPARGDDDRAAMTVFDANLLSGTCARAFARSNCSARGRAY